MSAADNRVASGRGHDIRLRYFSMFSSGARDTTAREIPRARKCTGVNWPMLSRNIEQPGQPASGQPWTPGANMKW